jgi:hypothetical protein
MTFEQCMSALVAIVREENITSRPRSQGLTLLFACISRRSRETKPLKKIGLRENAGTAPLTFSIHWFRKFSIILSEYRKETDRAVGACSLRPRELRSQTCPLPNLPKHFIDLYPLPTLVSGEGARSGY